ncbi:MAG TPA: DapH/DapD/GlmU-related protein [Burkholderiales bacterium]|nr:DapH/DapD/GlmU-related protein [Burkholderiales bacterium]
MIGILYRISKLTQKGANVGSLSVVGHVTLNGKAARLFIGRGCVIGSNVQLALHDEIRLGDHVVINDGVVLLTASHDVDSDDWRQLKAPIVIEDYAWIATNSIVLPGVTVGYGAVVGAGAVVTKNVPAYHVVAGNPARRVRERVRRRYNYSPVRFLAAIEAWVGMRAREIDTDVRR